MFGPLRTESEWMIAYHGYRLAMKTMYPDAETMFGQDANATSLTLTALALEELAGGL